MTWSHGIDNCILYMVPTLHSPDTRTIFTVFPIPAANMSSSDLATAPAAAAAAAAASEPLSMDQYTEAIEQFTVAEHHIQQYSKEKNSAKELKQERGQLRASLLQYLQENKIQCLPTGMVDPATGKPLYLRMSTQHVSHAPTADRVTEAIHRIDPDVLTKTMIDVQKTLENKRKKANKSTGAAAAAGGGRGSKKRKAGAAGEDVLRIVKSKNSDGQAIYTTTQGADTVVKSEPVTAASHTEAAAAPVDGEPIILQVLKTALKKQIRATHVTTKPVPALATSQVRGFKLDPAKAKAFWTPALEERVLRYRQIGKDLSVRIQAQQSVTKEAKQVKQAQQDVVKSFLQHHGDADNDNSRKIVVDDQPYRIKITTTDRVKPLTLTAVDSMMNELLEEEVAKHVQDKLREIDINNVNWSRIWTPSLKQDLLERVLDRLAQWQKTQRIVGQEVKMRSLKKKKPDENDQASGDQSDDEEEEENDDDEDQGDGDMQEDDTVEEH
jgi:hypothetical protein